MQLDEYDSFCASLTHSTQVVQWGGAHVWKVGGKVFAIARWREAEGLAVTFKCTDIAYEVLREQPGLRPAPHLASRGLKWIQHYSTESMDDVTLKEYLRTSHQLALAGLPKKIQKLFPL